MAHSSSLTSLSGRPYLTPLITSKM